MSQTKRIKTLAPEQVERLAEFRERWLARGLATGPCDRPAMETAVDEAYRAAGLAPPRVKIWLGSPMAGVMGAHMVVRAQVRDRVGAQVRDQVGAQVRDQVGAQVWDQVWDQVGAQVGAQVRDQVGAQVRDQVGAQVWDQVWDQVGAQVGAQVRDQVGAQVGAQVCYGQHDAAWLAFYDFFGEVLGLEICQRLRGLSLLVGAGWWWAFTDAVILTERPTELHRDDRGRLHNDAGPAILYPDGFAVHAVHGVRVPADIIHSPESVTIARINGEPNAEVRRVMIERYGVARYMLDSGSTVIHRDTAGLLYRKAVNSDEEIVMVRVLNSTPEPDGIMSRDEAIAMFGDAAQAAVDAPAAARFKEYMIRVPPSIHTARAAVAWTFGLPADEYDPLMET